MRIGESQWLGVPVELNSFWIFSKDFEVASDVAATLEIASDRDMEIWLNGVLLEASQPGDLAGVKSVTRLQVNLAKGLNSIRLQVYCIGRHFANYDCEAGRPGIAAILYDADGAVLCRSDATWLCRRNDAYLPLDENVSPQLGMCFAYDARKETAWQTGKPEGTPAFTTEWHPVYRERAVPPLKSAELPSVSLVHAGWYCRRSGNGTIAERCASDYLRPVFLDAFFEGIPQYASPQHYRQLKPGDMRRIKQVPADADGAYVIVDLGRETVGFLTLDIEASEGTVIEIAHGEHLDDGRVRCSIAGRNFADMLICRGGRNSFTHRLRRLGARYLELHIHGGQASIGFISLIEQLLQLPRESEFNCEDSRLLDMRRAGIHTLKCCMHEHYEDCPWREQALYAYDSRNQALFGYYAWGNYSFAEACFTMLGDNYMGNGQIALTAPFHHVLAIESFSLVWISEIYELYLFSGNRNVVERNRGNMLRVLRSALARRNPGNGLYEQYDASDIWTFFEWVDGLSGSRGLASPEERFHACFNAYLLEALQCANKMFDGIFEQEAAELADAINRHFMGSDCYFTTDASHLCHQHTQALMILAGVSAKACNAELFNAYRKASLVPASFSSMPYVLRAWMEVSPESRRAMEEALYKQYGAMLDRGATTFWETAAGGDDFYYAGSLCHAWSSLPVLYCHRYVLGVEPMAPGFAEFRVRPYCGRLTHAEGTVPTPSGPVRVAWEKKGSGLAIHVRHPESLLMRVESFPECPVIEVEEN